MPVSSQPLPTYRSAIESYMAEVGLGGGQTTLGSGRVTPSFSIQSGATQACGHLPEGWIRNACLIAAGFLPGDGGPGGPGPGCPEGWASDAQGVCIQVVPGTDPTPIGTTPGEASLGARGIMSPWAEAVTTLRCPTYADGKKGILWMNALSGEVVCLPRGVNGVGFGLIRKNKPRRKPYISAAEKKQLDISKGLKKKAKTLASLAGFSCETKAAAAARRARGK